MLRALLFSLALAACHESPFQAPAQPDLFKVPYDFGPAQGDGSPSADMATPKESNHDQSASHEDLATEHD